MTKYYRGIMSKKLLWRLTPHHIYLWEELNGWEKCYVRRSSLEHYHDPITEEQAKIEFPKAFEK